MLEYLALAWLYLVGLLIIHRLQDFTSGRGEYGLWFWPLLLAWPIVAPISAILAKAQRL